MAEPRGRTTVAALLSFNGGFVDTVGFLGLSGLFVAHEATPQSLARIFAALALYDVRSFRRTTALLTHTK